MDEYLKWKGASSSWGQSSLSFCGFQRSQESSGADWKTPPSLLLLSLLIVKRGEREERKKEKEKETRDVTSSITEHGLDQV